MPVKYSSLVAMSEKDIIKLLKKQDLTLTGDQATHIKQLARYLVELNMDDDINIQQIKSAIDKLPDYLQALNKILKRYNSTQFVGNASSLISFYNEIQEDINKMPLANDVMLQLVSHECPKDPERIRLYLEKLRQSAEENAKKSNMKSVVYYRTGEPLPLYKIAMKHNISKLLSTGQKVDYEKMNRQSDLLMTNHASWPDWLKTEITSHMRDMTTEESHTDATKKGVIFSMFIAPGVEKYFSDDADNSVAPSNKAKLLGKLSAITSTSIDEYTQEKEATLEKEQTPLSVRKVDSDHKKFRLTVAEIISPISNNHEFEEKSKGDKGTPKQSIEVSISSLVEILPNIDNDILLEITLEKLEDSNKTIQEKLISIGGTKDGKKILNDLADKVSEISQPWKQNPKYEKKWKITQWFIDKINGARQALGYTSSQEKVGLKLGASVSKAQSEVAKQMKQQTKDHQDPPSTDSSSLNPK